MGRTYRSKGVWVHVEDAEQLMQSERYWCESGFARAIVDTCFNACALFEARASKIEPFLPQGRRSKDGLGCER